MANGPSFGTRIAIIGFSSYTVTLASLTTNNAMLQGAVNAYSPGGYTHISAGLERSRQILESAYHQRPSARRAILLLTDGEQSGFYGGACTVRSNTPS